MNLLNMPPEARIELQQLIDETAARITVHAARGRSSMPIGLDDATALTMIATLVLTAQEN